MPAKLSLTPELIEERRLARNAKQRKYMAEHPAKPLTEEQKRKRSEVAKAWRVANRERFDAYQVEYKIRSKESIRASKKKWKENNSEKLKLTSANWRARNRDRLRSKAKQRIASNHDEFRRKVNEKYHHDYHTNPIFRLRRLMRERFRRALKDQVARKPCGVLELLGCTVEFLKQYIEDQFHPGMSWDNHGRHTWHIDHKKPLASFDLTDEEQVKQAFHYTNLQPLWAHDNWSKGARVEV